MMTTSINKPLVCLFLGVSIGCFGSTPSPAAPMWTAETFQSGGVRGFNGPGDISDSSMADLAATCANSVRFFVELSLDTGDIKTATAYKFDPDPLSSIVMSAAKYGFKVVIVLDDPINTLKDHALWENTPQGDSLRSSIEAIWRKIASKYKGNPAVAAYDIFNEPVVVESNSKEGQDRWIGIATSWIKTIRDIDQDHAIIFEPTPWASGRAFSSTLTGLLPFSNVVYSFHEYDPHSFSHQGVGEDTLSQSYPAPDFDSSKLADAMQLSLVTSFQQKFNVPIYVGEFGCARWAPVSPLNGLASCYNWVRETIPLFEQQGWSWSYHDWRGYYGWDPDMPESFFYQYPYVKGQPVLDWGLYDPAFVPGDANKNHVGFAAYRNNATDTMVLLQQFFSLNKMEKPLDSCRKGGDLRHRDSVPFSEPKPVQPQP